MGRKEIEWEEPKQKKFIEKELPSDKEVVTKESKIGLDNRKLLVVRFPREISDAARISAGDVLQYIVEKPLGSNDKDEINLKIRLIRK